MSPSAKRTAPAHNIGFDTRGRGSALQSLAVAAVALASVSWALVPSWLRHEAKREPLFWAQTPLDDLEAAGDGTFRARLSADRREGWPGRFESVIEGDRPLWRVTAQSVAATPGSFAIRRRALVVHPSDAAAATNGNLALRHPRSLGPDARSAVRTTFAGIQLVALVLAVASLRPRRIVFVAIGFSFPGLLGLQATETVLRLLPLSQGSDLLGKRLDQLRPRIDDVDVVFLGSSRVYRHLDPIVFDAHASSRGLDVTSFNVGVPDMRSLEARNTLRWILDQRPQKLRWLVADFEDRPLFVRDENFLTERVVRWHRAADLRAIVAAVARGSGSSAEKLLAAAGHAQATLLRHTGLGAGLRWARQARSGRTPVVPAENRGYLSLEEELENAADDETAATIRGRWSDLHDKLPAYRQRIRRLRSTRALEAHVCSTCSPDGAADDAFDVELIRDFEADARRAGVETLFVIDARVNRKPNLVHAHETGAIGHLLRFDDPDAYPRLYDPANRFDVHHLDRETAGDYSRLVAERLVEIDGGLP